MNRRDMLQMSAALGIGTSLSVATLATTGATAGARAKSASGQPEPAVKPLPVPSDGNIPVAFLISEDAVLIDFVGPWEVFGNVMLSESAPHPFRNYTVAESLDPVRAGGGMIITPHYTLATAPAPKVVVIPAQKTPTDAVLAWVRKAAQTADLTMSVCAGAFLLAQTGLLSGKAATTHHATYKEFAMNFPDIRLERGARFVDLGNLASSGGLSSGIDLALHVVRRYFGRSVATATAYQLEYQGQGWLDPKSNAVYAQQRISTDAHPLCAVCEMDVDKAAAPRSTYREKTYYFCTVSHKELFDSNPATFVS